MGVVQAETMQKTLAVPATISLLATTLIGALGIMGGMVAFPSASAQEVNCAPVCVEDTSIATCSFKDCSLEPSGRHQGDILGTGILYVGSEEVDTCSWDVRNIIDPNEAPDPVSSCTTAGDSVAYHKDDDCITTRAVTENMPILFPGSDRQKFGHCVDDFSMGGRPGLEIPVPLP